MLIVACHLSGWSQDDCRLEPRCAQYRRCPRLGRQVRYGQAAVQRWLTGAFGSDPERVAKRSQYPRAAEDGQAAEEDT
jgi:hypothetical protein